MLENLFNLIRNEEVVLWAGAGMSLGAGYPSGQKLTEILYGSLSASEKELINSSLPLPDFAEEFYRIKGDNKNVMIRLLQATFNSTTPISPTVHNKLATIPHFKTIITTNYDKLFENAYGNDAQLLFKSEHISYLEKDKTHVFKVHGDLSDPESVVLTKSDYENFFKNDVQYGLLWSEIKQIIAKNSIVFVGYNLEDPNVSVIFTKVTELLKAHRRECFLVSPNLPQHKINDLIKKGIHYINTTGEELFDQLLDYLKAHLVEDLEKGVTSAETFKKFAMRQGIMPHISGDATSYRLTSFQGITPDIKGQINFKISDESLSKDFNEFIGGNKFGSLKIDEDKLLEFKAEYGGIKIPNSKFKDLKFQSNAMQDSKFDVRFEDGFEFCDIPYKLYSSAKAIEIHLPFKVASYIIRIDLIDNKTNKVTYKYHHHDSCGKLKDEIEFFTLLKNLAGGKKFKVFLENGKEFEKSIDKEEGLYDIASYFLEYFNYLKIIENHTGFRFKGLQILDLTRSSLKIAENVAMILGQESFQYEKSQAEIAMNLYITEETGFNDFRKINDQSVSFILYNEAEQIIDLHDEKITLGFVKIILPEVYIENIDSISNAYGQQTALLKSKTGQKTITFTKELDFGISDGISVVIHDKAQALDFIQDDHLLLGNKS